MKNGWTYGRKLTVGFLCVALLAITMGSVSVYALRTVIEAQEGVITETAANLRDAEFLRKSMYKGAATARGYLLSGEARFRADLQNAREEFAAALARMRTRALSPAQQQMLVEIERGDSSWRIEQDRSLADTSLQPDPQRAAALRGQLERFESLAAEVRAFVSDAEGILERERARTRDLASTATAGVAVLAVLVGLVGLGAALLLATTLSRQIGTSVQHVRSSTAELQAAATQQAAGAREQSTAMTEVTTTTGELLVTSRQIAESAQRVSRIANDTAERAREGDQNVRAAQEAVTSIRRQVDTIVQHMLDLGRKSQQAGGILEIINELAEQTNILAINATIEAAGAGEAGRRFSVVGEEIRRLADRVGGSTKEIRALIEEIRAAVNTTVMATETGSKTVDAGAARFSDLAAAFKRIGELVETTTDAAREIELSTRQQAIAVEQVNAAIAGAAQASREAEAGSGQTLQTASLLATLSNDLARLIQPQAAPGGAP